MKREYKNKVFDYIVVGTGIAGLYSSVNIPENKNVLLITKGSPTESNSFYAQGGISVAKNIDDIKTHIQDTFLAGANSGNREAISLMVSDGVKNIHKLIEMGINFDKDENNELVYTKEGAHSTNRVLHIGGDATGKYMHSFLLDQINKKPHQILENVTVLDILVEKDLVYGVTVEKDGKLENIYCKNLILASGGIGNIYKNNTNSKTISGEIQGIAVEKNIPLKDMEMLQFHPTVFISKNGESHLLSEALRGEGAFIVDSENRRFLFDYDKRGELASRDIVSQAILKHSKDVFLSISHFKKDWFIQRFPTISKFLKNNGFNLTEDLIPISPAFHYMIGGIETDLNGKVKNFENLFAIGEIASTGVHGANRLASNSLLEAVVFAERSVKYSLQNRVDFKMQQFPINLYNSFENIDDKVKSELQELMWKYVSIERNEKDLNFALQRIYEMLSMKIGRILQLQLLTASKIVESAIKNRNSKGVHFRSDT